jgi:hypothetical protein
MKFVGDEADIWLDALFSTIFTGGTATFTLPNSLTIDTAKTPGTAIVGSSPWLGTVRFLNIGQDVHIGDVFYNSATTVIARVWTDDVGAGSNHISSTTAVSTTVPRTWANADRMHIRFRVPITGWKG